MSNKRQIQVFCTRSIQFTHPKDKDVTIVVRNHMFETVPSWIKETDMFKSLKQEGSIKVIETAKDLRDTEISGKVLADKMVDMPDDSKVFAGADVEEDDEDEEVDIEETDIDVEDEEDDEEEPEIDDLSDEEDETEEVDGEPVYTSEMTAKQLYKACLENGIEVSKGQSKAYYLKKLNG